MKNIIKNWWNQKTSNQQAVWMIFYFPPLICIFAFFILSAVVFGIIRPACNAKQFQAWEKLTGNPKNLTLEKFIHLPKRYK